MTSPLSADEVLRLGELARNYIAAKDSRKHAAEYGNADQRAKACHAADEVIEAAWAALADVSPDTIVNLLSEMENLRAQVGVLVGELCDIAAFTSGYGDVAGIVCTKARKAIASVPESASTLLREVARMNEYVKYWEARVGQCAAIEAAFQENTAVFERELARREAAEARVTELESALTGLRRSLSEAANTGDGSYRP